MSDITPSQQRIAYLTAAYRLLAAELLPAAPPAEQVALCYSFPSVRANSRRHRRVGECHYRPLKESGEGHLIAIAPSEWDTDLHVLQTLIHEMCHIVAGKDAGHGPVFRRHLKVCLQEGKPTASIASADFILKLAMEWRAKLPAFPAGSLPPAERQTIEAPSRNHLYLCSCDPPHKVRSYEADLDVTCNECDQAFVVQEGAPTRTTLKKEEVG